MKPIITYTLIVGLLFTTMLFSCSSGVSLSDYASLQADYDEVCSDLEDAQAISESTQAQLDTALSLIASTEDEYNNLIIWYYELREDVNEKHGYSEDKQLFITPEDEAVNDLVIDITGGYSEDVGGRWDDYKAMYDWVVGNIEYNYDSGLPYLPNTLGELEWYKDYWRLPSETIEDKVGDCEDMAVLLASMQNSYADSSCWCITWNSNDSGHAAVVFPVSGNELTILDPAGNYYTNKHGDLSSDPIQDAIDDWLAHWAPEPGIHVSGVFDDSLYESFDSTAEFVAWMNDWFD